MKIKTTIYISCLIVLMHCGKEELLTKKLSPFNKICCLQDSIFWRSVEALEYKNGIIYISDIFNNRILCYNEKENKVISLGRAGKGPGEFVYSSCTYINNNKIYAASLKEHKLNIYSLVNLKFIKKVKIPTRFIGLSRFAIDNLEYCYTTAYKGNKPILKVNINNTHDSTTLGSYELKNEKSGQIRSERHIFIYKNNIISLPKFSSLVKKYNQNGILISELDLSEKNNHIRDLIQKNKKNRNNNIRSRKILFIDAYLSGKKLYIVSKKNMIDVINIEDDLELMKKIILDKKIVLKSICVSNNNILLAHCARSNCIYFYNLNY
ncbi:MAG: 6-bladed beta-propeller [Candidatus Marinimicrobia bacterium]|nr:6-bladed beta-propeller [Candidatus Neomarinimicrobiota bacterium]